MSVPGEQFWWVVYQWIGGRWVNLPALGDQSTDARDMVICSRDFWSEDPSVVVPAGWYWAGAYERLPWEQWHLMIDPAARMAFKER